MSKEQENFAAGIDKDPKKRDWNATPGMDAAAKFQNERLASMNQPRNTANDCQQFNEATKDNPNFNDLLPTQFNK